MIICFKSWFRNTIKTTLRSGFLWQKNARKDSYSLWALLFKERLNNMANDKRFTFKFLGVHMEAINFTPKELRKTMWTAALIILMIIIAWRLPEIISAIR